MMFVSEFRELKLLPDPPYVRLGITEREYDALMTLRDRLVRGKIKASRSWRGSLNFGVINVPRILFIGPMRCIGGWMAYFEGVRGWNKIHQEFNHLARTPLDKLLFPPCSSGNAITRMQTVQAIDNFVATGDPRWKQVLGE